MSDTLRKTVKAIEDDISQLDTERASKLEARDTAKKALEGAIEANGFDRESAEYKSANDAVKSLGEIEDKLAAKRGDLEAALRMLGQSTGAPTRKSVEEFVDNRTPEALIKSEGFAQVSKHANSQARFGTILLGELPEDYALKADVSASARSRRDDGGYVNPLYRPLRLLDVVPTGRTDGNVFHYTQFAPGTATAAVVAEGALKPGTDAAFNDASVDIDTIAAWYKVRKQSLADAPAIRTILEGQLRFDVRAALEAAVLAEILGTAGIGTTANAAEPLVDLISHSMVDVVLNNMVPNAVVLHPTDWEAIRLAKDGNDNYIYGPPSQAGATTVFGMNTIPSVAMAAGTALVGAFDAGATILMREGMQVLISDSDQDDFIRNRVTLLGELRAGTAVWRPGAFSTVDLAA